MIRCNAIPDKNLPEAGRLPGQTAASIKKKSEAGPAFFERVCVNIFAGNTPPRYLEYPGVGKPEAGHEE